MFDKLYALDDKIQKKSKNCFIKKCMHKLMNLLADALLFTKGKLPEKGIYDGPARTERIVISLTSFPERIPTIHYCISSLLTQTYKPDRIILWLANEQFPEQEASLPEKLLRLKEYGLEIKFCDDIRSHKKYYYAMQEEKNACIVIFDDDIPYPENALELLIGLHKKYPEAICCNRAHLMKIENGVISDYSEWEFNYSGSKEIDMLLCPTGVGGVLYPPESLDENVFCKEDILKLCLYADDLWLKVMGLRNGYPTALTRHFPGRLFVLPKSQKKALNKGNVAGNQNDTQLKAILEKYPIKM